MTPKRKQIPPFDGYIRVSRVGGREGASFISPDVQRSTIERLAQAKGVKLGEVVAELDISGGTPIDDRELGRLVRKIEEGESGGLLVWKVSRFSRNLLDAVTVAGRIREAGGVLVGDDLDTGQPMGKALLGFLAGWAEEERDARRTGWQEAQTRAARRGVHPTRTPVGYVRDGEGRLVPDPDVGPVVTDLFRRRAMGASLQECCDLLEQVTGKGWSRSSIRQMFTSPTYLGHIIIGDGIYEEGTHEALVDEQTWQLAQREGKRPGHNGSLASQGVLAGLIRCAGCGGILSVTGSGPQGARIASYTCRKHRASGVCPAPASGNVSKIDDLVMPELQKRAKKVKKGASFEAMMKHGEDYKAAQAELQSFLAGASIAALGPDLYNAEVARRRETVQEALEAVQEATRAVNLLQHGTDPATAEEATPLARDRELARKAIESVTLRKAAKGRGRWDPIAERVEVTWRT